MGKSLLIITGASKGLGRCIATAFLDHVLSLSSSLSSSSSSSSSSNNNNNPQQQQDYYYIQVILMARSREGLEETKRLLLEKEQQQQQQNHVKVDVTLYPVDLGDLEHLDEFLNQVLTEPPQQQLPQISAADADDWDRIVLINNAGSLGHLGPCWDDCKSSSSSSLGRMKQTVDLNITSSLWISARFAKFVMDYHHDNNANDKNNNKTKTTTKETTIVNISSLTAVVPFPTMAIYSAGKAARDMYHACLAKEFESHCAAAAAAAAASSNNNNNNNCTTLMKVLNYAPGPLETDMTNQLRSAEELDTSLKPHFRTQQVDPNDSARALARLVWENSFVNGSHVDYYDIVRQQQQQNLDAMTQRCLVT